MKNKKKKRRKKFDTFCVRDFFSLYFLFRHLFKYLIVATFNDLMYIFWTSSIYQLAGVGDGVRASNCFLLSRANKGHTRMCVYVVCVKVLFVAELGKEFNYVEYDETFFINFLCWRSIFVISYMMLCLWLKWWINTTFCESSHFITVDNTIIEKPTFKHIPI